MSRNQNWELADYPFVKRWKNRHGVECWRYYRYVKTTGAEIYKVLPGVPGDPLPDEFDVAYQEVNNRAEGKTPKLQSLAIEADNVVLIDGAKPTDKDKAGWVRPIVPQSFADAWRHLRARPRWQNLDAKTLHNQSTSIEEFLNMLVDQRDPKCAQWRDMPVTALRRLHVEDMLDWLSIKRPMVIEFKRKGPITKMINGPHKAAAVLKGLRKLIKEAMRQGWIDYDVARNLDWEQPNGETSSWRPWEEEQIEAFEEAYPIGTLARLVYALARELGNRRSDVATVTWEHIKTRKIRIAGKVRDVIGFDFRQYKNRNRDPHDVFLPITPDLQAVLDAVPVDERTGTIVKSRLGKGYVIDNLSRLMRGWLDDIGVPHGYSLHGLRKALSGELDDAEATPGQNQDVLGHKSSAVNDGYRKARNKARNAVLAMDKVVAMRAAANDDDAAA